MSDQQFNAREIVYAMLLAYTYHNNKNDKFKSEDVSKLFHNNSRPHTLAELDAEIKKVAVGDATIRTALLAAAQTVDSAVTSIDNTFMVSGGNATKKDDASKAAWTVFKMSNSFEKSTTPATDFRAFQAYYETTPTFKSAFDTAVKAIPTSKYNTVAADKTKGCTYIVDGIVEMITKYPDSFIPVLHLAKDSLKLYQPYDSDDLSEILKSLNEDKQETYYREVAIKGTQEVFGFGVSNNAGTKRSAHTNRTAIAAEQEFEHNRLFLDAESVKKIAKDVAAVVKTKSPILGGALEEFGKSLEFNFFDGILDYQFNWGGTRAETMSTYFSNDAVPPGGTVSVAGKPSSKKTIGKKADGGGRRQHGGANFVIYSDSQFIKEHPKSWTNYYKTYGFVYLFSLPSSGLRTVISRRKGVTDLILTSNQQAKVGNAPAVTDFYPDGKKIYEILLSTIGGEKVVEVVKSAEKLMPSTASKNHAAYDRVATFKLDADACERLGWGEHPQCGRMLENCETGTPPNCYQTLTEHFESNDDGSPNAIPIDFGKGTIAKSSPLVIHRLLQKIDWPAVTKRVDGLALQFYSMVINDFIEHHKNKYQKAPDTSNQKVVDYLINCASYVNTVYPQLLNPGTLKSNEPVSKGSFDRREYTYQVSLRDLATKVPSGLAIVPNIVNRNRAISNVALSTLPRNVALAISVPGMQQGGGVDEHGIHESIVTNSGMLRGMDQLSDYYDVSIKRLEKAYEGMGKTLHPDVNTKLKEGIETLRKTVNTYTDLYNTVTDYISVNRYVKDVSSLNPSSEQMKRHIEAFKNAEESLNASEIKLAKYMSRLQRGYIKVYTDMANENLGIGSVAGN